MPFPAAIPSPTTGVWWIGSVPIRAYALAIVAGIIVALWLTQRRITARGGSPDTMSDVSVWAIGFGILGGRLYHVITTPQPYFGEGGDPWRAFHVWEGGLGIWGAVALGALGAWIGCRRHGHSFADFADALAPGLLFAQALGRLGNWFNNELYGRETDVPWALTIHRWDASEGHAVTDGAGEPIVAGYYHPTFLYELLWCVGIAVLILWLDRRFRFRRGQVFGLYLMGYTAGRLWIELMRSDPANLILGQRVNTWVSILIFLLGVYVFWRASRHRNWAPAKAPARERVVDNATRSESATSDQATEGAQTSDESARDAGSTHRNGKERAASEPDGHEGDQAAKEL